MTAVHTAGAASRDAVDWHAIDWQQVHRRASAPSAYREGETGGRWGKVKPCNISSPTR